MATAPRFVAITTRVSCRLETWILFMYLLLVLTSAMDCNSFTANRRTWLASIGTAASALVSADSAAANDSFNVINPNGTSRTRYLPSTEESDWQAPWLYTKLGESRILANELTPLSSSLLPSLLGGNELYYPSYLFGAWDVRATLQRKKFPYGADFVPSSSLLEGSPRYRFEKVGDSTAYEVHYFSTLANTVSNQFKVNLGLGVPSPQIIADRAYNIRSISRAYQQLTPVEEVIWDYSKDPTRLTLRFAVGSLAEDMQPLGPHRGEVYLGARQSELFEDDPNKLAFCAAEQSRSVTLATRSTFVSDIETITEFHPISSDNVQAIQRIAVYLTPNPNSREGVLWQQIGGKAVAFYDYEISMTRRLEAFDNFLDGSHQLRACVTTPKDVVQCY